MHFTELCPQNKDSKSLNQLRIDQGIYSTKQKIDHWRPQHDEIRKSISDVHKVPRESRQSSHRDRDQPEEHIHESRRPLVRHSVPVSRLSSFVKSKPASITQDGDYIHESRRPLMKHSVPVSRLSPSVEVKSESISGSYYRPQSLKRGRDEYEDSGHRRSSARSRASASEYGSSPPRPTVVEHTIRDDVGRLHNWDDTFHDDETASPNDDERPSKRAAVGEGPTLKKHVKMEARGPSPDPQWLAEMKSFDVDKFLDDLADEIFARNVAKETTRAAAGVGGAQDGKETGDDATRTSVAVDEADVNIPPRAARVVPILSHLYQNQDDDSLMEGPKKIESVKANKSLDNDLEHADNVQHLFQDRNSLWSGSVGDSQVLQIWE